MKKKRGYMQVVVTIFLMLFLSIALPVNARPSSPQNLSSPFIIGPAFTSYPNQTRLPASIARIVQLDVIVKSYEKPLQGISQASQKLSEDILSSFASIDENDTIIIEIYGNDIYPLALPDEVNTVLQLKQKVSAQPGWFESIIRKETALPGTYKIIILDINADQEVEERTYNLEL